MKVDQPSNPPMSKKKLGYFTQIGRATSQKRLKKKAISLKKD
jgi:hypothetical protein